MTTTMISRQGKTMPSRQLSEYGDPEVAKATLEKLCHLAGLTAIDREIIYLRLGCDWRYEDIAKEIGQKHHGRTSDNPMWEGTIRYRVKIILKTLRKMLVELDFDRENH